MSTISPVRATLAFLAIAALLAAGRVDAAEFSVSRGINMDQWVTWPAPDRWHTDAVLGNFPEWKAHVSDEDLAGLREAGLDFVRMPVDPAIFLIGPAPDRQRRLMAQVSDAVERLRAAGLKVIVDLHTIPRANGAGAPGTMQIHDNPGLFAAYRQLVSDMAAHLARFDPEHVALEPVNEPLLDCRRHDTRWQRQLMEIHAAARAANTAITLVLQGACWGSAKGLAAIDPAPLHDDNVIWSFHAYEPFILTHQGASWAGTNVQHLFGLPYPFPAIGRRERAKLIDENRDRIESRLSGRRKREAIDFLETGARRLASGFRLRGEMRKPFRTVARWADRHRIPHDRILLGEFGMIRQDYGSPQATLPQWRAAWYRDMIALAEKHGFAWAMWSWGGAFGVIEAFDGEQAEPDVMDVVRSLPAP